MNDELYKLREGLNIELKEAAGGVPKSLYETYSAFCNTNGGSIYLGIRENKDKDNEIIGISSPKEYIKQIFDTLNNKSKVSANLLLDSNFEIIDVDGKYVLKIDVFECGRGKKPIYLNNIITNSYKRNNEGDYLVSKDEFLSMINDNYSLSNDSEVNTWGFGFEDIDMDTLKAFRNIFNTNNPNNIYMNLDDEIFCKKIGILKKNKDYEFVLTNAAVLFFTNSIAITTIFPNYFLDYQENLLSASRWDYRLTSIDINWNGNIFEFFRRVINKIQIGLPNRFMTDSQGVDISHIPMYEAMREALVNAITNADFICGNSIFIKKTNDRIIIKNSGKPLISINEMITGGNTNPRNKELMRYFRLLDYSQHSGYGIPNIFNTFNEYDLPAPNIYETNSPDYTTLDMLVNRMVLNDSSKPIFLEMVDYIDSINNGVTQTQIAEHFGINRKTVATYLDILIKNGLITTNGKRTKGKLYLPSK